MDSLINKVLEVENEAAAIIEKAHAEAKEIEKRVGAELASFGKETAAKVEQRIVAFREEAMRRHEREAEKQAEEARKALEGVGHIPAELISRQVEKVVARFREI